MCYCIDLLASSPCSYKRKGALPAGSPLITMPALICFTFMTLMSTCDPFRKLLVRPWVVSRRQIAGKIRRYLALPVCVFRELKHATFLSHGRTPEVYCFPILPVLTLPHLYF